MPSVWASQSCGTVSTKVLTLKQDEYRVIIVNAGKKAKRIDSQVSFKSGKHRLVMMAVKRAARFNSHINDIDYADFQQLSEPFSYELDVKPNKFYRLVAYVEDKAVSAVKRRYGVKVINELDKSCDANDVIEQTSDMAGKADLTLPSHLQYRLSLLMKDIKAHYLKNGVQTGRQKVEHSQGGSEHSIELVGHGGIIDVLGIVIDYQVPAKYGLKVLAVTPASAADNIGLKPGDVIVSVNELSFKQSDMDHQQMVQAFKLMFKHLTVDKPAAIRVDRDGEAMTVNAYYEQVSIPEYKIQLNLK